MEMARIVCYFKEVSKSEYLNSNSYYLYGMVDLNEFHKEGALESMITLELVDNNYTGKNVSVKNNQVVLVKQHSGSVLGGYMPGDEVYVLSEDQASDFTKQVLCRAKSFEVAHITQAEIYPSRSAGSTHIFYMNPNQRAIYHSLGHDSLVIVKKEELDSAFNYTKEA